MIKTYASTLIIRGKTKTAIHFPIFSKNHEKIIVFHFYFVSQQNFANTKIIDN